MLVLTWSASRRTASPSPRAQDGSRPYGRLAATVSARRLGIGLFAQNRCWSRTAAQGRRGRDAERRHRFADDISRSTGPSAARPSPRRENGVRPAPLSWMSRRAPSRPVTSPSRIARPSPSLRHELAELVAGIGGGNRLGPGRDVVAGEHPPRRRALQANRGRRPRSRASSAFSRTTQARRRASRMMRAKKRSGRRA